MPTSYPNSIQLFPTMQDMTASDALLVTQFQQAMQAGNVPLAQTILAQITDKDTKIISAELLNTAWDTLVALQKQFITKYSPAYIISETQPADQEIGDYWFEVVKTEA